MERLYIIGNGFDLSHGIRSKYSHFREYLEYADRELSGFLEEHFCRESLWSDFEETLADLDIDSIVEDATEYLVSYGAEEWSDAYHHSYQNEIYDQISLVTTKLREHFTNWILQIEIRGNANIELDSKAKYITFNYTNTLERIYKIENKNILYIHNKAIDDSSILILGHRRTPHKKESFDIEYDIDGYPIYEEDPRIAEGQQILDSYFVKTYKPTDTIIRENLSFFKNLSKTNEIYVLGHSMSPVDLPYFQEIINNVDLNSVKWKISAYNQEAVVRYQKIVAELNIPIDNVIIDSIENLNYNTINLF